MAELIAFDKNEKLQFEGYCKLIIDPFSSILLVEPKNEEYKMISALFKWHYVAENNILFVFAEHSFQDFALIFSHESKCKKVFNILVSKKVNVGRNELIQERFLPPFFEAIATKNEANLMKILAEWITKCDKKAKEKYIEILKKNKIYDCIFTRKQKHGEICDTTVENENRVESNYPVKIDETDSSENNPNNERRVGRKSKGVQTYNLPLKKFIKKPKF